VGNGLTFFFLKEGELQGEKEVQSTLRGKKTRGARVSDHHQGGCKGKLLHVSGERETQGKHGSVRTNRQRKRENNMRKLFEG